MVMKLKTNEAKSMQFDIAVHGIDYNVLQGSLKFMIEGIEYGFPVNVLKDEISVDVPALDEIIKRGLIDGSEVECKLDIFGEGFYMSPWQGQFKLITPARVEATMVYSDSGRGSKPSITLTNKSKDSTKQTIVKEETNKVSEEKEIKTASPLFEGNETQQMLKLLEKLVAQRHFKESDSVQYNGYDDEPLNDELDDATDTVDSQYEEPNEIDINYDENNDEEYVVTTEVTDAEVEDGIVAKVGKKDVIVDKCKKVKESVKENKPVSKYVKMKNAVDKVLNKDPNFIKESKEVKSEKRRKLLKALLIKESKINKTKKSSKVSKKKVIAKEDVKQFRLKQPGEVIHESDITNLFRSVGMTSPKSQHRLIERAKDLGNTSLEDIYSTVKKFIGPSDTESIFDFINRKIKR